MTSWQELLALRFGAGRVTSIDVDPYLTAAAAERLDTFGTRPRILICEATGDLPGSYDRIVPMVSLPGIPAFWLTALRPAGRLVFSLTGGSVLITARKTADGGALGRVEYERASFMAARHSPGSPLNRHIPEQALNGDGEQVTTSAYPVVDPAWGWELNAMLSVHHSRLDHPQPRRRPGRHHHHLDHPQRRLLGQGPSPGCGTSSTTTGATGSPMDTCPCAEPEPGSNRTAPAT